ncbi:hypothetical protein FD08_GL001742 [Lentilactobacillus parakefiri DSM 10551]|nr:hypothetical protein FD08_GL001742 [Lentilactobacillus parakefiri DSM 10551]
MIITSSSGQGMVNTIATDRYLRRLKENQQAVHDCLEQTDPETRQIIHTLYFSPGLRLTLRDVSIQLNMSLATISRKRKRFMNNLGKQLGLTL